MEYVRLGKLVDLKQGLAINSHTNHLVCDHETSLALLRIADMPTKRKVVFMDENTPDRYIAVEDDIIYTRTGQVGLVFTGQKGVVHNNCFRVIPIDEQTLSRKYLFWVLSLPEVYYMANIYAAGSAQPDLPHTSFKKIKIPISSLPTQNKIAAILSAYGNMLENNNRRIRLLEQMAVNLYKEWFIRFRFPGHDKVEFEEGLPKGWEITRIKDAIVEQPKSKVQVGNVEGNNGQYPFYTSGANILQYNQYLVDGENILLNTGGIADVKYSIGKIHYSTDTWCIKGIDGYTLFLYLYLKGILPEINASYFEGAALKHLKKASFKKKKILLPPETIIERFNQQVSVMYKEIFLLKQNNQFLSRQRDLLLPRLMSGKLEVKA